MKQSVTLSSIEDLYSYLESLAHARGTSLNTILGFFHSRVDPSEDMDGEWPALVYAAMILGVKLKML